MAKLDSLKALRAVVETRDLRKHSAAARVSRQAQVLAEAKAREGVEQAALKETQLLWSASLEVGFDPILVGAWAGGVLKGEAAVRESARTRSMALADLEIATADQALANAHREAAASLLAGATRAHARKREEEALLQAGDRIAQTWRRP